MRIDSKNILKSNCTENSFGKKWKKMVKKKKNSHLKTNSVRNMSELLSKGIKRNIDVLMISERKIDDSFLVGNLLTLFRMEGWQKSTPLFFPVTSTNSGIGPQNFLTFSFKGTLMQI